MFGASLGGNAAKTSSGIGALDLSLASMTGAGSGGATICSGSGGSWFSNGGTAGTKFGGSSTL